LRLNLSKQNFLEECRGMMLSVTNVKAIFPFMKVILAEVRYYFIIMYCIKLVIVDIDKNLRKYMSICME